MRTFRMYPIGGRPTALWLHPRVVSELLDAATTGSFLYSEREAIERLVLTQTHTQSSPAIDHNHRRIATGCLMATAGQIEGGTNS